MEVSKKGEFADIATDYIAFNPNQVKSATDNNGMFSNENDDIQMAIEYLNTTKKNALAGITEIKIGDEYPIFIENAMLNQERIKWYWICNYIQ